MGEVIKQAAPEGADSSDAPIKEWDVISNGEILSEKNTRRKKIIKAREAVFSSMTKQISSCSRDPEGAPHLTLLRRGNDVHGLEILCRCGEKITVHFNFDDENGNGRH